MPKLQYYFEGERGRAVIRFWKAFAMSLVSQVVIPMAEGVKLESLAVYWQQIVATALLIGLGLGGDKMIRAIREKKK